MTDEIADTWWPLDRIGEAIEALALRSRLIRVPSPMPLVAPDGLDAEDEKRWIDWATARLGIEAVAVDIDGASIARLLHAGGPAILRHDRADAPGFFALLRHGWHGAILLDARLRRCTVRVDSLRAALAEAIEAPLRDDVDRLLDIASVAPDRRSKVGAAMLHERLVGTRVGGIILLRLPASASVRRQMTWGGTWRLLTGVLVASLTLYVLELAGWRVIGSGLLAGRVDPGWLAAWVLILLTAVAVQVGAAWFEARFAIDVGRILKARLLAGALALRPAAIKRSGVGHMIGRVIESQALEALFFNGGLSVIFATLELAFAGWILAQGAAPSAHVALLVCWTVVTGALAWRYFRRLRDWSADRLDMTNALIEAMVGHRTRLAQERAGRRDAQDDGAMQAYLAVSRGMDLAGLIGVSGLSSLWLFAGIASLVPVFSDTPTPSPVSLAISLGGLLLAQRGFAGIASGLAGLARAGVAWRQVRDIFQSARPDESAAAFLPRDNATSARLLEGEGLTFRYPGSDRSIVDGADLTIDRGDHILLEGASGGGKSTIAALLTGLEHPDSGLLLLNGLDRPTLGDEWHRIATAAPQFHDNHILSGTLAFNLLMGRRWPATAADLREAEAMCEDLGLGDLLRRMPSGIDQMIGETGWQLSHGERSRIFLARALLQGAALTVMDESFAALDPETLDKSLAVACRIAPTLIVIAHP